MKHVSFLLAFFICAWCCHVFAQQPEFDSLTFSFRQYGNSYFGEKIFLHTDRSSYLTGETLWFKAYRVDATGHRMIDWSKILYVEILDKNNASVLQAKFLLDKNGAEGSLFLPASLASGNYVLRAYTNWMKNAGADFFFHQPITILNPFIPLEVAQHSAADPSQYDIQFFPEGGDLVYGLESVVGVRAVDKTGNGIVASGVVLDVADTVARFSAKQFGLAKFSFIPKANHVYHVIITDKQKKQYRYTLPAPKAEGYVMQVSESDDGKINVLVRNTNQNSESIYLLGHTRQALKVQQRGVMQNGVAKFELERAALGAGISVFTIFDPRLQPVCERLYFKKPEEKLNVTVTGNPYLTKTRERVTLDLFFDNKSDTLKDGVFSLAVYQLDSLDLPTQNIRDYVWLSSDLAGVIENPAYYFGSDSPELTDNTDNLMLTHGWRRLNWDAVRSNKIQNEFLPEIGGHLIYGQVMEKESGKPADRIPVYLTLIGRPINTYISQAQRGRFLFETEPIVGNRSIIAQADPTSSNQYKLQLDDPFFSKAAFSAPEFSLTPKQTRALEQRSIHMQVQNLFYGPSGMDEAKYPFVAFYGKPDESYQLDDYTRFPTLEEVMREYVPGVRVKKKKDEFHLSIIDQANKVSFSDDPLVLVDGVPVFIIDRLMEIDPLKLKQLDVIKRKYYLNAMAYDGIVSFTSYKGDLAGYQPPEQALLMNYKGLESKRKFFSPYYSPEKSGAETLPDARRVLFWTTGTLKDVNHRVAFFTSDIAGEYRIVIQALTSNGLPGSYSTTFVVK